VLGYLDDARELITLLNNYIFHHQSTIVLQPLWLAWAEVDSWPEKEKRRVDEGIEEMGKMYYEGLVNYGFNAVGKDCSIQDDAAGVAELLARADQVDEMFADATSGYAAMIRSAALSAALELRLKLAEEGEEEKDGHGDLPSVESVLSQIAKRLHSNAEIGNLAQMARAWKILKNGALARMLGVRDAKIVELAN
jgi:hypothetical protein